MRRRRARKNERARRHGDVGRGILSEPAVGIEPTTARLRIGCSTTELRWRVLRDCDSPRGAASYAQARTRTATPFGTTPSRWRVYQFHHLGPSVFRAGLTGLEPATSGVTVRHSNQLSYSPRHRWCAVFLKERSEQRPRNSSRNLPRKQRHVPIPSPALHQHSRCTSRPAVPQRRSCNLPTCSGPNGSRTRLCTLKECRPNR